jgi:hypothetical protein
MLQALANFFPRSSLTEISELPDALKEIGVALKAGLEQTLESYVGTEDTDKLYDQIKTSIPRYFLATRSFAQFKVPDMPPVLQAAFRVCKICSVLLKQGSN